MSKYLVGVVSAPNLGMTKGLVQSLNWNFAHDESETPDESGNVAVYQQYNHRAEGSATIRVPRDYQIPAAGASVYIKGISLPTYSAQGVPTGGYTIASTPVGDGVEFIISNPSINMQNTEVTEYSMTVKRYLENGIGSQTTDISDSESVSA